MSNQREMGVVGVEERDKDWGAHSNQIKFLFYLTGKGLTKGERREDFFSIDRFFSSPFTNNSHTHACNHW